MKIAAIIFYSLFGVVSLIQLFACFSENTKLRKITKSFCMLFLGIGTALFIPNYPLIYTGIFCGMLGDLFLIFGEKKAKLFFVGSVFFFVGHILYAIQMISLLSYTIPWYVYVVILASLIIFAGAIYPITIKKYGKLCLAGDVYIPFLFIILTFSLMFAINVFPSLTMPFIAFMPFIGYIFFIFSDIFLVITKFLKPIKKRDFYIMLTYLIAQLLIGLGLVLILIK